MALQLSRAAVARIVPFVAFMVLLAALIEVSFVGVFKQRKDGYFT